MKKRFAAFLLAAVMLLSLAACGTNKLDKNSLPPLEEEGVRPAAQTSEPAAQTAQSRTNVLYEETLDKGLLIRVYSDGELLLENGNVEENLINRNIFKVEMSDEPFSEEHQQQKLDELAEVYLVVYSSMLSVALFFLGLIGSLLWTYFIKDEDASSRHYVWIKRIVFVTNIILIYAAAVLAITTAFFMMIS